MLLEDLVAGIWLRNRAGPWKRPRPSLFQCLPDIGLGTGTDERECRKQDLPRVGTSLGATWSHRGRLDKSIYSLSLWPYQGLGAPSRKTGEGRQKQTKRAEPLLQVDVTSSVLLKIASLAT